MSVTMPETIKARREEIICACEKLYSERSYNDITIKDIGEETSFNRTSIYNYFQTKEEIFVEIYIKESSTWLEALKKIYMKDRLSYEELADEIAHSIENRKLLLKLLGINIYDLELNSSCDSMKGQKCAYIQVLDMFNKILVKHCPEMTEEDRRSIICTFFPFLLGVYTYINTSDEQIEALNNAGIKPKKYTIYHVIIEYFNMAFKGFK